MSNWDELQALDSLNNRLGQLEAQARYQQQQQNAALAQKYVRYVQDSAPRNVSDSEGFELTKTAWAKTQQDMAAWGGRDAGGNPLNQQQIVSQFEKNLRGLIDETWGPQVHDLQSAARAATGRDVTAKDLESNRLLAEEAEWHLGAEQFSRGIRKAMGRK